jgi:dipeptidase E
MKRRLLLISNSTNFGEEYLGYTKTEIKDFLGSSYKRILFIPYAGVTVNWDDYAAKVKSVFNEIGCDILPIHKESDPVNAVQNAEVIVIGGGNTFYLVHMLHKTGIINVIREKINSGTPYIGWSAGSNVACPTLCTTNDMPIIQPASFNCINLIPFQINPHYTDFIQPNHAGETREQRLQEYLKANPEMDVVGLRESTMLRIEGQDMKLIGKNKLRYFKFGKEPKEFSSSDNLNFLLK